MGFLDTHDAFVDARKNWSKYNLGVDFDTAWQEYYDKHYDPDNLEGWADPIWSEEAWNDLVRENGGDPDTVKEEYSDSLGESVLKSFDLEEEYRNTFKDEMDESLTEAMDFETWFNTEGWGQKTGQTFDEYVKDFPDAESLRHATPEEIRNNAYQFYDIWHVDSADRELAFEFASDKLGIPYDDLYNSWLDEVPINESMTDDADTQYTNGEIDYDEYLMLKTSELYNSSDKMRKRIDNWFEKNYPGAPEYKANIGELSGDELNRLLSDLGYKGFKTESLTEGAMTNGSYSLYNGWVKVPDKDSIPDEYPELEPEYTE